MDLSVEKINDVAVVTLNDDYLDASNSEEFKRDMTPVTDADSRVVLDLSRVEFIDSTGLGAILSCLRRITGAGGDLKLGGVSKQVRAVFELSRMHRIVDILDTRDEAVKAFGQA